MSYIDKHHIQADILYKVHAQNYFGHAIQTFIVLIIKDWNLYFIVCEAQKASRRHKIANVFRNPYKFQYLHLRSISSIECTKSPSIEPSYPYKMK